MTTETFWTNFIDLVRGNNELQKAFIQKMNNEQDQNKRFERLSALVHNLHKDGILSENRIFLQKLADDILLLHILDQLKYILNGLSLREDPGIQKIQETHIRILQLYDISHLEQFKEKYQDINASIKSILQPVYKFLKEWHKFQDEINLDELSGFQSFIKSSTIPDLILILSIHLYITDPSEQNQEMLQEIANLNLHYFTWFNAFKNVPKFHNPLFHGMIASTFLWILDTKKINEETKAKMITLNEIDKINRLVPKNFEDYPYNIIAKIIRQSLQNHKYREKSFKAFEDFLNLIDTMGYSKKFVDKLGEFFKIVRELRYSPLYNETKEYIGFLSQHLLDRVNSESCWDSLVDHALMFVLTEKKFRKERFQIEKIHDTKFNHTISNLSDDCLMKLIQHAFFNINNRKDETDSKLLNNTSTFLLLDPVLSKWRNSSRKELLKRHLKNALSDESVWNNFSEEGFPYYPLLASLDQWIDENESIGVSFSPFGKLIIESIGKYLINQEHKEEEILLILRNADLIFSSQALKTLSNTLLYEIFNSISNIIPNINTDRYRKIIKEFLENKAIQKAISEKFIEELARETIRQKFASYIFYMMAKFLRDVLYAYVHRGKRKSKWKDTVGLRESIEKYIKTKKVDEDTKKILMEIKDMIR